MPITITQTAHSPMDADLSAITPSLCQQSLAEIEKMKLCESLQFADCFRLAGNGSDNTIILQGDFSEVDFLGSAMTAGTMHIESDVGHFVGGQMSGGVLHVHGSAASRAGAAAAGRALGMRGGTLLIDGDAGPRLGYRMRRGTIAVAGATGAMAAASMRAGTIVIRGDCGPNPGVGLRRGTLLLCECDADRLLTSFPFACHAHPLALDLVVAQLRNHGWDLPAVNQVAIHNGDVWDGYRGEIWLAS